MKQVGVRACLMCALAAVGGFALANPTQLWWAPQGAPVWDGTSLNWRQGSSGGAPTAWIPGAVAIFGPSGGGGFVDVSADVSAGGIEFASGGYTLVGYGRIRLEGDLSVVGGVTNSVGTEVFSAGGVTKTGTGAVALGKCVGPVTVAGGDLLAVASDFADAQVTVNPQANAYPRLVTAGEPEHLLNLVRNGGFESGTVLGSPYWTYVNNNPAVIADWGVAVASNRVGRQSLAVSGSPWNTVGSAPEGSHVLILQFGGAVTQGVAVAQAGWYQVAFSYFLRSGHPEVPLYVTLDGVPFAPVLNDAQEFNAKRYVSVPVWLEPGTHLLGFATEAYWEDRATMIDDVVLAPAFSAAGSCRSLGGDSSVALMSGAAAVLGHSGNLGVAKLDVAVGASVSGPGTWGATMTGLWFDYAGGMWSPPLPLGIGADALLRMRGSATVEGTARRVWVSDAMSGMTLQGAGLVLTATSPAAQLARFSVTDMSSANVNGPLTLRERTALDVFGALQVRDTMPAPDRVVSKRGFGEVRLLQPLALSQNFNVVEGLLKVNGTTTSSSAIRGGHIFAFSLPGRTSEVRLMQAGATFNTGIFFSGSGRSVVSTDLGGGAAVSLMGHPRTLMGTAAEFAVPTDNTLSIPQLVIWQGTGPGESLGGLLKSGPGTLEIREGGYNTTDVRAHRGRVTLRNGTLRVLTDDTGPYVGPLAYNGTSPDGRGGSLGRSALTDAVCIGDDGTQPGDNLTFVAAGHRRYIGHDFEVFNRGAAVRFEAADSTNTMFAGTFTLHRDVTFAGRPPNTLHLSIGAVVQALDYSGTEPLSFGGPISHITFLDAVNGAGIHLDTGGVTLRFGVSSTAASHINRLSTSAGAALGFNFGGGECSSLHAADITLAGPTAFNLYLMGSDYPFSESGTFTLMTASNTMSINAGNLSVANAVPGFNYIFNVSGNTLTLTVQNVAPSAFAAWANKLSGDWGTGPNWDSGIVPGSGATALMGSILTNHATVTLAAPFTVGSLVFNNTQWGYTLAGSPLTIGGTPSRLDVLNGAHTIRNTLAAATPLEVAITGGSLKFDDRSGASAPVILERGPLTLAGEAALTGGLSLAPPTALTVSGSNVTIGASLDGTPDGGLTLQGGAKLTVAQTAAGAFGGLVNGPANTEIVRAGGGRWSLNAYRSLYQGAFRQTAGETVLAGVSLLGAATAEAGAALTFAPAATNGLMGYYYYVGDSNTMQSYSNAFLSVTTLDALTAARGRPGLIHPSGLSGDAFNYPLAVGAALTLPYPFGTDGLGGSGPNQDNFIAVWRGSVTLPETGFYSFGVEADDFILFALDGEPVYAANRYIGGTYYREVYLNAGRHDILVGLGQLSGNAGVRLLVRLPSATAHTLLPNAWLTPMPSVASLNSAGATAVAPNASVRIGGASALHGALDIGPGGLLEKGGTGMLDIWSASGQASGDVSVRDGTLVLRNAGRLAPPGRLTVDAPARLSLLAPQTAGALAGKGPVSFGYGMVSVVPFTGDSDSEISPAKTYTHLLDFPMSQSSFAIVNGVMFGPNAGLSFTPGPPPSAIDSPNTLAGIARLLSMFYYNSADYTFRLSGLRPFTAYEVRLYFQKWSTGDANRNVTFTFTSGRFAAGSVTYNIDFASDPQVYRHQLRCRYVTDADGTLDVRCFSHTSSTCHLFALSNETTGDFPGGLTLTLAPPPGMDTRFGGTLNGVGALVKSGDGLQRFSGTNALTGGLVVQAGEAMLEPGAAVIGTADIRPGATLSAPSGNATLGGLTGSGLLRMGDAPFAYPQDILYQHFFTDDATSQISPLKRYTHKLDFGNRTPVGGLGAIVNGVPFYKAQASGSDNGYGWSGIGSSIHGGNASAGVSGSVYGLLTDMTYGIMHNPASDAPGIGRLTGLTPGKRYEVRIYNRIWDPWGLATGLRKETVRFIPAPAITNAFTFEQDGQPPNFLAYRYTATSDTLTFTYETHEVNATWHFYALTNEEAPDAPVLLDMTESTAFGGTITGPRGWEKRGPGTLLLTGANTATGPLAITGGAVGIGNGGTLTLGPVLVQSGAQLFGHGHIGGNLTVAEGASLKWRYASPSQADTITLGGTLTLPASGVVYAAPAAAGVKSPTKWSLILTTTQVIGPADLSGWVIDGLPRAKLVYGNNGTGVFVSEPRGTVLLLR